MVNLQNKSVDFDRLEGFGFEKFSGGWRYKKNICDDQFLMTIEVAADGKISTRLEDSFGEEYILHLIEKSSGKFVGEVRQAHDSLLNEFAEKCCVSNIFCGEITQAVINYVRENFGGELEFLWEKFPDVAIWRRADSKKWYGALMRLSERKLKLDSDKLVDVLDLRGEPEEIISFVDGKKFFPGWHMNKKHWFTVRLDGSLPFEKICQLVDKSYNLAKK